MADAACAITRTPLPSPPLPQRKSGLPDLRKISRDPGKPGARGEGADRVRCRIKIKPPQTVPAQQH